MPLRPLPIDPIIPSICYALSRTPSLVIQAPPGAGSLVSRAVLLHKEHRSAFGCPAGVRSGSNIEKTAHRSCRREYRNYSASENRRRLRADEYHSCSTCWPRTTGRSKSHKILKIFGNKHILMFGRSSEVATPNMRGRTIHAAPGPPSGPLGKN